MCVPGKRDIPSLITTLSRLSICDESHMQVWTGCVRTTSSRSTNPRPVAINEAFVSLQLCLTWRCQRWPSSPHIDLGVSQQVDRYCNWHYRHQCIRLITFSRPSFLQGGKCGVGVGITCNCRTRPAPEYSGSAWTSMHARHFIKAPQHPHLKQSREWRGMAGLSAAVPLRSQIQIRIRPELIERGPVRNPIGLAV